MTRPVVTLLSLVLVAGEALAQSAPPKRSPSHPAATPKDYEISLKLPKRLGDTVITVKTHKGTKPGTRTISVVTRSFSLQITEESVETEDDAPRDHSEQPSEGEPPSQNR